MKKILIIYVVLIAAVLLLASMRSGWNLESILSFNKPTAQIKNIKFNLIVAKSDKDKVLGLSNRKNLAANTGMLFVFDTKGFYPFWMKDMKFPIDIIYIDKDTIVDIISNASVPKDKNITSLPVYKSKTAANYVLEINSGLSTKNKFKIGDKVKLQNIK